MLDKFNVNRNACFNRALLLICVYYFIDISKARNVVLEAGDVLYLPHGWWHYVENLETAISINVWIPQVTSK